MCALLFDDEYTHLFAEYGHGMNDKTVTKIRERIVP